MLQLLQSKDLLAVFAGTVVTALYLFALKYYLTLARRRRRMRQLKLHAAISNGLCTGALVSVDDFVNVYKGVNGLGADDVSYRAGLAKVLREYIVDVVSNDELDQVEAKKLKDAASAVLAKIEADSPFADLPAAERNLLVDMERFVKANDQQSALRKIEDLAGLIEVRQDSLERVQASNKWSVPLALAGLVLTVTFGIISIISIISIIK